MNRLVVIGGGISGLTAAWAGVEAGYDVTVLEAAAQVGGKLRVEELAGVPVDVGAEALLATRPEGRELIDAVGLTAELMEPTTTVARIRVDGRAAPLPARTMMGIPADLTALHESGVLTPAGLAAVAAEAQLPPLPPLDADVPVGALVRSRLGDEVVDRLVDPLLGGVYAGSADALSVRATLAPLAAALEAGGTSLLAAARAVAGSGTHGAASGPVFVSLRGGLGRLPAALAAAGRFAVRTGVTVRSVVRTPTGFALEVGAVPRTERIECEAVVVATPPAKAARLLREVAPGAGAELAGIDAASVAIVSLAFPHAPDLPGSGLLVASSERLATKAVTLTSAKWPIDVDGTFLLRASVGRMGETLPLQLEDRELIALVRRELRALLGLTAEPRDARVTRWGGGLPQYAVGHVERVARIRAAVREVPGLGICGAALDGVGVPACIASARAAVGGLPRGSARAERGQ